MFLGMPIAIHYVRPLCDKYFLSYGGFLFLTGIFMNSILKQCVVVEWDPRRTAA